MNVLIVIAIVSLIIAFALANRRARNLRAGKPISRGYDPLSAQMEDTVSISEEEYIVVEFSDKGEDTVSAQFLDEFGRYIGERLCSGPREATMICERESADQPIPGQFDVCKYMGSEWIIFRAVSDSTGVCFELSLRWVGECK